MMRLYLLRPFLKMLLAVGVFFIVSLIGFSYLKKQAALESSQLRMRKVLLEKEVYEGAKARGEMKYISSHSDAVKVRYQNVLKSFPTESQVSELLANITKIGTDDGLKFISFTPKAAVLHEYYAETPVEISVIGTFHQLAKFLSSIANLSNSVVAVNQFSMTRAAGSDVTSDQLSLQFTATIYYVLPNAAEINV